jgi:23S rRNA A2030 N6-methylase RlmJ
LIYRLAEQNLKNQASVLLDPPFVHEMTVQEWQRGLQTLARRSGAALIVIYCACSDRELERRMGASSTTQYFAKL